MREVRSRARRRNDDQRGEAADQQLSPDASRADAGRQGRADALRFLLGDSGGLSGDWPAWLRSLLRDVREQPPRSAAPSSRQLTAHRAALCRAIAFRAPSRVERHRAARPSQARDRSGAVRAGRRPARQAAGDRVMLDLTLLPDGGASWLDASGEHADIVISTRIRLARNLEGYAFTPRARDGERLRILTQVREAFGSLGSIEDGVLLRVDELPPEDRLLLHERHLVSKELAGLNEQPVRTRAAVYLSRGVGIMVNEEDHLRLQALHSGFHVADAFGVLERLDAELGNKVPYAFHSEFGYLTACPTNVGTGLRASVLIHLPALVLPKEIGKVLAGLQQVGLTYRGMYGEGSEVVGNFFQISNQTTLGRSEGELLDYLVRVVRHVIEREEEARRVLLRDAGYIIEDKLWRAFGTLRYARSLSFEEAMNYLSGVRLAVGLKLISGLSVYTLNKLLIFSQLAHLGNSEGRALTESEANVARARYVRETLAAEAE